MNVAVQYEDTPHECGGGTVLEGSIIGLCNGDDTREINDKSLVHPDKFSPGVLVL